jgi:hypothetical protein
VRRAAAAAAAEEEEEEEEETDQQADLISVPRLLTSLLPSYYPFATPFLPTLHC